MMRSNNEDSLGERESLVGGRERWSHPAEFLLTCLSMSVGLGNVWRFPFVAYENGGGVFLLPYFIVLFLIGRPLYFMELALGQFSSRSSVKMWSMVPALRGIGYGQMIANFSILSYITFLLALSIYYLIVSLVSYLPWMNCDPELERPGVICLDADGVLKQEVLSNITVISAAEQYFVHQVLDQKVDIGDGLGQPGIRLTLCLATCWVLLFFSLWKGVKSSGKVACVTAILPYIVLSLLLVRGVTLPGATTGLQFYVTPKWSALFDPQVWYAAVTQSFYSLGIGYGSLVTFGSHNHFQHNVYRDAVIVGIVDTFTSFLAGLVIFFHPWQPSI